MLPGDEKPPAVNGITARRAGRIGRLIARILLLALTVFLLWYGLSHGGWDDLKSKAIRICYECIGIG